MRVKLRATLLVLAAVFAMGTVAAASASAALPEIVNKAGKALVKDKFTGEFEPGGVTQFRQPGGVTLECEGIREETVTGAFGGLKTGEATFTFKGCSYDGSACKPSGEVVFPTSLTLVYLSKATKELALLAEPHALGNPKEALGFTCGAGFKIKVSGSFLIRVEPVNALISKLGLDPSGNGTQSPNKYENEKGEQVEATLKLAVNGGTATDNSLEFQATAAFEEEVEFKG